MTRPEMILFDFGNTLFYEERFDGVKGVEAVLRYAVKNKDNLTAEEISRILDNFFVLSGAARSHGMEIPNLQRHRALFESLGLLLSITLEESEKVFCRHSMVGRMMPHTDQMLAYLKTAGIRSAVISNISYSGDTLKEQIDALFPENDFEFILSSCDYLFRKPSPVMFQAALHKAGLPAGAVWFCGDNTEADIKGADSVGMFPVWYQNSLSCHNRGDGEDTVPVCPHLHIREWPELISVLGKWHDR